MQKLTIHITGMSCGHCMNAVTQALAEKPGVRLDSLRMGRAEVSYDDSQTDPAAIEALIGDAGYTAVAVASDSSPAESGA